MADKIIQTQKTKARNPRVSFVLSLICTGLGQMYNGDLARGAAFCLLRTVPLLALPAWVITRRPATSITTFIYIMLVVLIITIASPLEALIRVRRKRELPVRFYNLNLYYAFFVLVQVVLTSIAVLMLVSFFNIERVKDESAGPLLQAEDIILVNRYMPQGCRRGELVTLAGGVVGRVVAMGGDAVKYDNNMFYVNGMVIPLGYLADGVVMRFSSDRDDVVSEANDGRKYPVRFKQSRDITLQNVGAPVRKGMVLVADDTRLKKDFARIAPVDSIRGRVEGILFSTTLSKIGMDAYGGLR
jgi:signal peptidase I